MWRADTDWQDTDGHRGTAVTANEEPTYADFPDPQYAVFGPTELFKLTGMTPALQRVWRRRGQLPGGDVEPYQVTARVAAEIFIRHQLAGVGIPPSESENISHDLAPIIFWFALLNTDGACEVTGSPKDVDQFITDFANSDLLASRLAGVSSEQVFRFVCRYAGSEEFSLVNDFRSIESERDFTSVAILDLHHLGSIMGARAGRPLLTVELAEKGSGKSKWIRRLTRG